MHQMSRKKPFSAYLSPDTAPPCLPPAHRSPSCPRLAWCGIIGGERGVQQMNKVLAAMLAVLAWAGVGTVWAALGWGSWGGQTAAALVQAGAALAVSRMAGQTRHSLGLGRPAGHGLLPALACLAVAAGAAAAGLAAGPAVQIPAAEAERVLAWLRLVPVAAVCEELVFRGAVQGLLSEMGGWAVAVQGLVFAAAHGAGPGGLYALAFGLALGWLRQRTGSVWPGAVLHGLNNGIVFWMQS